MALPVVLGVKGYIRYVTYINELPDRNAWGIYPANISNIPGQPFEWAVYLCLGDFQIATVAGKIACREYIGQWGLWKSVVSNN